MKKYNFLLALSLILGLNACKQDYTYLSLRDAVPVDVITVDNAVYYDAVALYSTKRDEFQQRIFNSIEKKEINNCFPTFVHIHQHLKKKENNHFKKNSEKTKRWK